MSRHLTARIAAAIAVVGAVFVASIVVLAISIADLRDSSADAAHAERTLAVAENVGSLVVDAETGVRGFAITDEDRFLEPLTSARRDIPAATRQLGAVHFADDNEHVLAMSISTEARAYITDYADPLVQTLRSDPAKGRSVIVSAEGKRRVDSIRGEIADLTSAMREDANAREAAASSHASRAMSIAVGAGFLAAVLFGLLTLYLARSVAAPIRRAAEAADRIGKGDLGTRLNESRADEIGRLNDAFNAMGEALLESNTELESQHAELEAQNSELERQAVELESQAVELEAQASELEAGQLELTDANAALTSYSEELQLKTEALSEAHGRVGLFAGIAEELGRRTDLTERADTLLRRVADMTDSAVGVVFTAASHESDRLVPVCTRGVAVDALPHELTTSAGLAGRALEEARPVHAEHVAGDLTLQSFGRAIVLRHELHVPLIHGDEHTGVLSLGRTADRPYDRDEVAAIEHIAEQAAVALANSIEAERSQWLA
ncbi:MAG: CHASE3 domain-containing protein, partial [Solirubrobacteraceae bacterium]